MSRIIFAWVIFSTFKLMSAHVSLKISWKSNENLWKLNLCTAENVRQLLYRDSLIRGEDSCPMGQDHDIAFSNPGNLQNRKIKGQNQMAFIFFNHFLHGSYLNFMTLPPVQIPSPAIGNPYVVHSDLKIPFRNIRKHDFFYLYLD